MHRYEYKYLVPHRQADEIRAAIQPFTVPDPHNVPGRDAYTIRSIYFDTALFRGYYEKKEGLRTRRKLRIRGYNEGDENSTVYLEIKRRRGLPILKARAPMRLADVPYLLATGDLDQYIQTKESMPRAMDDARSFLYYYHRYAMRSTVKVVYEREAHFGKFDNRVRVTLDLNLRGQIFPSMDELFHEDRLVNVHKDHFTLEIKFTGLPMPVWARTLVERIEGKWRALSKYTMCLDAHNKPIHRLNAAVHANRIPLTTVHGATIPPIAEDTV